MLEDDHTATRRLGQAQSRHLRERLAGVHRDRLLVDAALHCPPTGGERDDGKLVVTTHAIIIGRSAAA
jgi:hypothetical protein